MQFKITPGPWEVVNRSGQTHSIRMYHGHKSLYGVDLVHRQADAQAIAAVPDILDALMDIYVSTDDPAAKKTALWALEKAGGES